MNRIYVRNLEIYAFHGVMPQENVVGNKFLVNIQLDCDLAEAMENDDIDFVANNMKNLLENVTLRKHRVILNIKEAMKSYGSLGTMMSGSGPTVFAFFDDMLKAQECYDEMKKKYKDVFISRTI